MGFKISSLWRAPEVNPVTHKARTVPILNPFNIYGRVFFFTWWSFFISFWSWYAWPPLTVVTIREDLSLTTEEIATANIVTLAITCIVRVAAGFACDKFGPRKTYITIMLAGSLPTALAGTVTNAAGLIVLRCFTGILGATFVPCEVWSTAFFDKSIVGTSNAFAAGWGNAGGGITYFVMPAIFDSLVENQGLDKDVAWRVTFIVPFILIIATTIMMIIFCPDTPLGSWSERHRAINRQLAARDMFVSTARPNKIRESRAESEDKIELSQNAQIGAKPISVGSESEDVEADDPVIAERDLMAAASWELVQRPTMAQSLRAVLSLHTFTVLATYFCSFGTELTLISFLGAYYYQHFDLTQTSAGNWAAMFGLLNFVNRPIGGLISDAIYRPRASLWGRKAWLIFLGLFTGVFFCIIGALNPESKATLFGLMVGLAFFMEAANGANFALVPHVHPSSNGIISGLTGAAGTLGGVVFTLVARHFGEKYHHTLLFMGIWTIVTNLLVSWIPPISKKQLGGR